jgi:Flp pilus assembly protein TadD
VDEAELANLMSVYESGRLDEAASLCREILSREPDQLEAAYLLGRIHLDRSDSALAVAMLRRAVKLAPDWPEVQANLGAALFMRGELEEATYHTRQACALDPEDAEAQNNLGFVLQAGGRAREAEAAFLRALELRPDYPEALSNLGGMLHALGRHSEAMERFRSALSLDPDNPGVVLALGEACLAAGDLGAAESEFARLLTMDPASSRALKGMADVQAARSRAGSASECVRMGQESLERGDVGMAETAFRQALELCPENTDIQNALGVALTQQQRYDEAVYAFREALRIDPRYAAGWRNLATVQARQGREMSAVRHLRRALDIDPGMAGALDDLARVYMSRGRHEAAEELWRRAAALIPQEPMYCFHLAMSLLSHGRCTEAWSVWDHALSVQPGPAQWSGEPGPDATLIAHSEAGYGDDIQFVRYLGMVKSRWRGRVVFYCTPHLFPLFEASELPVEIVCWPAGRPYPKEEFDAFIGLISMPFMFRTDIGTIPARVPYLTPPVDRAAKWRDRLETGSELRVGLVWAGGGRENYMQSRRSCNLRQLAPLAGVSGVRFYSLQVGADARQLEDPPEGLEIVDLGKDIQDFADTAAILQQLDLLISIDTAAAHLAGALGRPVWTLLLLGADWRWMVDREDSPWYPTMRLFRQPKFGAWAPVWDRVAQELRNLVESGRSPVG